MRRRLRPALAVAFGAALLLPRAALAGDNDQGAGSTPCVNVQIGKDKAAALDCLNEQLRQGANRAHDMPQPTAPLDASSPSNQVGTANDAAAREKMGNSFGLSATPQRPPSTVTPTPLIPTVH